MPGARSLASFVLHRRLNRISFLHFRTFTRCPRAMTSEFRLKEIASLKLKDGEMLQVEIEGIEGGKALLANTGGSIHAMSANCTHYGAPLKNGVLSPDGRLICPWHGACFNVLSGDVEDAPALDPLSKYQVFERDGGVYLSGDEAIIKANRRIIDHKCSASSQECLIVVGGGSGAIGLLQSLRENGFKDPITLISRESHLPIDRTKLSKALIQDANKLLLRPQDWYDSAAIKTITDEVSSVDFTAKNVSTVSGKSYSYSKLILATGGTPVRLPLPGFDLGNIFVLRDVQDVQAILAAVGESKGKRIVVIGTGFIGLEVGNALAKENNVTLVGMETAPLEQVLGAKVGGMIQRSFEKNGMSFHMSAKVTKATPSSTKSSQVGAVHIERQSGEVSLEADIVILGVGVKPATDFLRNSDGINLEKDKSLKTDTSYAVEGLKDVFAIGDIATFPYFGPTSDGALTRIEHWNVAQNQGRHVGAIIANPSAKPKPFIPVFWSALGSQLRYCGNSTHGWDEIVHKGDLDEGKFAAYYCKGNTVAAVATMGMDPVMAKCADLMTRGKMPGKVDLQSETDILSI